MLSEYTIPAKGWTRIFPIDAIGKPSDIIIPESLPGKFEVPGSTVALPDWHAIAHGERYLYRLSVTVGGGTVAIPLPGLAKGLYLKSLHVSSDGGKRPVANFARASRFIASGETEAIRVARLALIAPDGLKLLLVNLRERTPSLVINTVISLCREEMILGQISDQSKMALKSLILALKDLTPPDIITAGSALAMESVMRGTETNVDNEVLTAIGSFKAA